MRSIITSLSFILFVNAVHGQQSIDSVVIRENRLQLPYNQQNRDIQVIGQQEIKNLPVKSTNELLAYVAGVDIRQRGPWGAQADISIDGSTFDQVLVLINGVRMSDPQTGHNMMNLQIPLTAIDRIEVLRGAAARTYGTNALAGAINIVTRIPAQNTIEAQAYAGSSFEKDTSNSKTYNGAGIQVAASLAGKKQAHILSIGHDAGNGYRYNTDFKAYRLYYQNTITLNDKNKILAMGGYTSNKFGASLFYAAPNDVEATETVQTAIGSIAWQYKPNDRLSITPRISLRYNKDDYIYIRQKPEAYHNIHETNTITGDINATYKLSKGTVGVGLEYRREAIVSNSLGKRNRENLGAFAEYSHIFNSRLNATAGLYLNSNSFFGTQLLPGADIGYKVHRNWKVFASGGAGQRQPTYTDLYYKGPANVGNDSLQVEKSVYGEGGLEFHHSFITVRGSYGYRHISDFIDWARANDKDPWQPQNFGVMNTEILSFRTAMNLNQAFKLPSAYQLGLTLSYTHLNPSVKTTNETTTKYNIDALRHQAIANVTALLWGKLQLGAGIRYQQRLSANDYTLVDARIGYKLKNFLLYADGNNLLNTNYREIGSVPLPGRWMSVGVRFSGTY